MCSLILNLHCQQMVSESWLPALRLKDRRIVLLVKPGPNETSAVVVCCGLKLWRLKEARSLYKGQNSNVLSQRNITTMAWSRCSWTPSAWNPPPPPSVKVIIIMAYVWCFKTSFFKLFHRARLKIDDHVNENICTSLKRMFRIHDCLLCLLTWKNDREVRRLHDAAWIQNVCEIRCNNRRKLAFGAIKFKNRISVRLHHPFSRTFFVFFSKIFKFECNITSDWLNHTV